MKLFIARHGEASFDAASDRDRPLTKKGIEVTANLVDGYLADLEKVKQIWCSELLIARETAAIYGGKLNLQVQIKAFLAPDCDPEEILDALNLHGAPDQPILLVSHQPLVGNLVSFLCAGNLYDAHPFVTSEVLVLEFDLPARGLAKVVADLLPR